MGRGRYLLFYLAGGLVVMLAPDSGRSSFYGSNLRASGAIAAVMGGFIVTYPRDRIKAVLSIFVFVRIRFIPAALLIGFWNLTQLVHAGAVAQVQTSGVAYLAHIGAFFPRLVAARMFEGSSRSVDEPSVDRLARDCTLSYRISDP